MLRKLIFAGALLCVAWLPSPSVAQNPVKPQNLPTTNASATIATGNTFQTVLSSSSGSDPRNSLTIENNNASDNCWIVIGGVLGSATKSIAILLIPGGSYTRYYPYVPSDAIHATCASTNDTLYIDRQ